MDRLDVMQLFVRVADTGSFSKAARSMNVSQSAVSKQIAALEERLGARLLHRTTRDLALTSAGQDYYESAVRLLEELQVAEARVGRGELTAAGRVRVAISAGFGRLYVVPKLPAFLERYPNVTLDLDVSDRQVNLIEEGIDVALRIGTLHDSELVAKRIGSVRLATVASPAYLERHGEPAVPDDLAAHACVSFISRGASKPWTFKDGAGTKTVEVKGALRSNDAENVRAAVLAGMGIGHNPSWLYAAELASGAVKEVLTSYVPDPYPIHAVCPAGRRSPTRVRAFIDFLAELCAADEHLAVR